ncbi:g13484 [Coccomyxa viridis]|uniref:Patatin n=1 Tax=Coccomyxa viridis TaxID=1274662 RepID=A0ABP1GCX4_9CHLO
MQSLQQGKSAGLNCPPRHPCRSSSARQSHGTAPSFLRLALDCISLFSPVILGHASWALSTGPAKVFKSGNGKRSSALCFSDLSGGLPYFGTGPGTAWLDNTFDLVLSSGFLAFASHSGFLKAVSEAEINVGGVMGTSAGALSGSLYSAGYSPKQVAEELSRVAPVYLLRPSCAPWTGGAISLAAVVERLKDLLPPTFEDLNTEFAVGVVSKSGEYRLIDSGALPEAVAASAAIPFVFEPVEVPGQKSGPFKDGGLYDRTGLKAWRQRRVQQGAGVPPALVHLIARSSGFSGADDVESTGERRVTVVRSPKSGVNFFSLGDFEEQLEMACERAQPAIYQAAERNRRRAPRILPYLSPAPSDDSHAAVRMRRSITAA